MVPQVRAPLWRVNLGLFQRALRKLLLSSRRRLQSDEGSAVSFSK